MGQEVDCAPSFKDAGAPMLFAVVPELPRGALIEKQVLVHTGQCEVEDDDGTLVRQDVTPVCAAGECLLSPPPLHAYLIGAVDLYRAI